MVALATPRCDLKQVATGHAPDCIGNRWSLLALLTPPDGALRFTELKRAIGESDAAGRVGEENHARAQGLCAPTPSVAMR